MLCVHSVDEETRDELFRNVCCVGLAWGGVPYLLHILVDVGSKQANKQTKEIMN